MLLDITIPGKPVSNNTKAWFNPKLRRTMMYKPKQVKDYKNVVQALASAYMDKNKISPTSKPVVVNVYINLKIPKSYSKKRREELLNEWAPVKPDIDNCLKLVIDAISKDPWHQGQYLLENDNQVCEIYTQKKYAEEASVRMTISEAPTVIQEYKNDQIPQN